MFSPAQFPEARKIKGCGYQLGRGEGNTGGKATHISISCPASRMTVTRDLGVHWRWGHGVAVEAQTRAPDSHLGSGKAFQGEEFLPD